MKNYITLLALFIATTSFSQVSIEKQKMELRNLIQNSFDEIWSDLNASAIKKYYTEDFLLLEHGEIWNNDTIANYLNKAKLKLPKPKRTNTIGVIDVKINGTTAWIAYHNYATFTVGNETTRKAYWLESATAILTENGWRLDMLHSTRVKRE